MEAAERTISQINTSIPLGSGTAAWPQAVSRQGLPIYDTGFRHSALHSPRFRRAGSVSDNEYSAMKQLPSNTSRFREDTPVHQVMKS